MKISTSFGEITFDAPQGTVPETDFVAQPTGQEWGEVQWVVVKGPQQFIELLRSDQEHYQSSGTIDFSQIWEQQEVQPTAVLSPN